MHKLFVRIAFAAAFCSVGVNSSFAQQTDSVLAPARIVGRVIDELTGIGIAEVVVQVVGTNPVIGTRTGLDGRYTLRGVPAAAVSLTIRRIGYQGKEITGIWVDPGKSFEQNIALTSAAFEGLATVVVTAEAEKGTVAAALDAQRTAVGVVNSTTAEQISRSADGNAAQAVQRVSGMNVGEGGTLTARGLTDKYTISNLNGARIPSPEPEKRVVPLDMFPSGLLQSITTAKTFTPDLQGDFAGALVDIKTKEFPASRTWSAQFVPGYASGVTGSRLMTAPSAGGERFGAAGSNRALPALVRYVGNFEGLSLSQNEENLVISEFRNAWTPRPTAAAPNASGSVSFGGNDPLLFGHRVGYLVLASLSSGTDIKARQVRALATRAGENGEAREIDRFEGQTVSQSVLWGGIANLSTMIGASTRISLNGMYNRTADNDARVERGSFENEGIPVQITRLQYVQRSVRSVQLAGEHEMGRHKIDWAGTASGVHRDEPDRSEFIQAVENDGPGGAEVLRWLPGFGSIRTFSALSETSNEARANYQIGVGGNDRSHLLKFGALMRTTNRNADNREYSIYSTNASAEMRALPAEQLFDGRFTAPGDSVFHISALAQGGNYSAKDNLRAGYGMVDFGISPRIRLIAGARFEHDRPVIVAKSTLGDPLTISKDWTDVLPSATLNVQLSETQQLRIAASRTLARPEYRELVPIATREVLNGEDVIGNDKLERARIFNGDVRWEWYRGAGEVLSFAVFAKTFDKPIERVYRASAAGHMVFYTNAERANNYGVEIEWRHQLGSLSEKLEPFSIFSNLTMMHSEISLGDSSGANATNLRRRMVGQAPYVANAGLMYTSPGGGTTATLLFNRVGERIDAAGELPLPDVIQQARTGLDLSVRFPIVGGWSGRFDAKNLLDVPFRTLQGHVVREEYRLGRVLQGGIVWKP
jgi:hypothetical protein